MLIGSGCAMSLFNVSPVGCECGDMCDEQCCHCLQFSDLVENDDKDVANMLMECNDNCACDINRLVSLRNTSLFCLTLLHFQMPI